MNRSEFDKDVNFAIMVALAFAAIFLPFFGQLFFGLWATVCVMYAYSQHSSRETDWKNAKHDARYGGASIYKTPNE